MKKINREFRERARRRGAQGRKEDRNLENAQK